MTKCIHCGFDDKWPHSCLTALKARNSELEAELDEAKRQPYLGIATNREIEAERACRRAMGHTDPEYRTWYGRRSDIDDTSKLSLRSAPETPIRQVHSKSEYKRLTAMGVECVVTPTFEANYEIAKEQVLNRWPTAWFERLVLKEKLNDSEYQSYAESFRSMGLEPDPSLREGFEAETDCEHEWETLGVPEGSIRCKKCEKHDSSL